MERSEERYHAGSKGLAQHQLTGQETLFGVLSGDNLGHRTREYRARNVDPFCALYSTAEFGASTQGGRFIFPYHIGKNVDFTVISVSRDHDLSN